MLNTAWPSLNWHLYDYYLDPAGAYFGAKKANEGLHIQFSYDTGEVRIVNRSLTPCGALRAELVVRDVNGSVRSRQTCALASLDGARSATVGAPEIPGNISATYFLELELFDERPELVSRNVYWLSTKPDVVDWAKTFWQHSPQAEFADLTGLEGIPVATIEAEASSSGEIKGVTAVTIRNTSPTPAVDVHCSIVAGDDAAPVTPVLWDDNDVTLFGGQAVTLTARDSLPHREPVRVRIGGFNVNERAVVG
jgi:exo-1,4-beta-D-glucosaminidase